MEQCSQRLARVSMLTCIQVKCFNGHVVIRTGPESNGKVTWSNESHFLLHHMDGQMRVHYLPGEGMVPGCSSG